MYIGLDQSLTCSGFALYFPEDQRVEYGSFRPSKADYYERADEVTQVLLGLVGNYQPEFVFIEQAFYFSAPAATLLMFLEHVLKWELYQHGYGSKFKSFTARKAKGGWPKLLNVEGAKEKFAAHVQPYCSTTFVKETHAHNKRAGTKVLKKKYIGQDVLTYDATDAIGVVLAGAAFFNQFNNDFSKLTYQRINL